MAMHRRVGALLFLLAVGAARAQDCGYPNDQPGRFGPHDYRDPTKDHERYLVDGAHFPTYLEELAIYGFSSHRSTIQEAESPQMIGGNIDYTLYAFPNHTRAMYAMGVWHLKQREQDPVKFRDLLNSIRMRTAECYFERAIMFVPNDAMVHLAYGAFLHKAGDLKKAAAEYQRTIELMPDMAEAHYNLGLLYVDLGDYAKARAEADIAYGAGYPLNGLRNKLARVSPASRPSATPKPSTAPVE